MSAPVLREVILNSNSIRPVNPSVSISELNLSPVILEQLTSVVAVLKTTSLRSGATTLQLNGASEVTSAAAQALAHDTGRQLYRIDLRAVVSKFIGETEKNLDRIFRDADSKQWVMFFDEADALFGKRTEVKNGHDRYANVEIAYLQQRLKTFHGFAIFATNTADTAVPDKFFRYVVQLCPVPKK